MQIGNDYNAYQNLSYGHSHTHHITECMHEEGAKKREGNLGNSNTVNSYQRGDAAKQAMEYIASFSVEAMSENKEKKGIGTLKGYWDSLGEDKEGQTTINLRQSFMNGIHAATSSVQNFFSDKVVHRLVTIREKIKTAPAAAIKRFGKGKEAFDALLGGNTTFGQKNRGNKKRGKEEEIKTEQPVNAHLMDSYNRTGGYCQLQENLTYQKPKSK